MCDREWKRHISHVSLNMSLLLFTLSFLETKSIGSVLQNKNRKEVEMNVAKLERTLLRMSILFQLSFSRVDFDGNGDLAVKGRCKRFEGSTCM